MKFSNRCPATLIARVHKEQIPSFDKKQIFQNLILKHKLDLTVCLTGMGRDLTATLIRAFAFAIFNQKNSFLSFTPIAAGSNRRRQAVGSVSLFLKIVATARASLDYPLMGTGIQTLSRGKQRARLEAARKVIESDRMKAVLPKENWL